MRSSLSILFVFSALLLQVLASPTAVPPSVDSVQERETPSDVNIASNDLHERHDVDDHDHDDGTDKLGKRGVRGTWLICKKNHLFFQTTSKEKFGFMRDTCPGCGTNGDKVLSKTFSRLQVRRKERDEKDKGWNYKFVYYWDDATSHIRTKDGSKLKDEGSQ